MPGRTATYLHHVTLDTGHRRRSSRDEVADAAVATIGALITRALDHEQALPLPAESLSHYSIEMRVDRGALLATVSAPLGPHIPGRPHPGRTTPIATVGIARRNRGATALWGMLIARGDYPVPAEMPSVPWAAATLYPAAGHFPDALAWLGDLSVASPGHGSKRKGGARD